MTHVEFIIVVLCIVNLVLVGLRRQDRIRTDKLKARWAELRHDLRQTKEHYDDELSIISQQVASLDQHDCMSATTIVEESNPIHNIKERDVVIYGGLGGRSNRTLTERYRTYSKSDEQDIGPTLSAAMGKTRKRGVSTRLSGLLKFFNRKK